MSSLRAKSEAIQIKLYGLVLASLLLLTACGHQDQFPMENQETGEKVICQSGEYWFDEGTPQMRVAMACINSCENHGFKRFTGNSYTDAPHPHKPPPDLIEDIPQQCLP